MEHEEIQNSTDAVLELNRKKKDFRAELVLFFVLGFLVGITFKTEAVKRITIGFEDYKIKTEKDSYNISVLKRKILEEAKKIQQAEESKMEIEEQEIPTEIQPDVQINSEAQ